MKPLQEYLEIIQLLAPSLTTAGAIAVGGSQVGTFVLLRREAMSALALPQMVAVGAAVSLRFGWPTLPPAVLSTALAVMLLAWSKRHHAGHWMLPALYVAGLSLSFLLIANSGAHVAEMQNLFTGIDVAVSPSAAMLTVPVALSAAGVCALLWRRWLAIAQIPTAAELAGLSPARWDTFFLTLLATVLVLGTSALGAVMVLAMLFLPPAVVLPWCARIPTAMIATALAACSMLAIGFVFSVEMDWPLSQSVGGIGFGMLIGSQAIQQLPRTWLR